MPNQHTTTKKRPVGRPGIMSPELVSKLEHAYSIGCTDIEACLYAGISRPTLYNYQTAHPEFLERKEMLKQHPVLKARNTVVEDLDDTETAKWMLERKARHEFATKQETTVQEKQAEVTPENLKEIVLSALKALSPEQLESVWKELGPKQ